MVKEKAFTFDDLKVVHTEIQDASPEPNMPAIEAHEIETGEQIAASIELKDSKGTLFDPTTHAVNSEGEPSVTSTGKWRRKKGLSRVQTQSQMATDAHEKQSARAAGQLAADLLVHSAIMLGGPEWNPVGSTAEGMAKVEFNEHENLRRAFADYFEAKSISDFPPGIALSIAVSGYMVPRFAAGKETQSRVKKAKGWFAGMFAKFKRKKEDKDDAAQPDTRDNGLGKDDTGKATSEPEHGEKARGAGSRSDV